MISPGLGLKEHLDHALAQRFLARAVARDSAVEVVHGAAQLDVLVPSAATLRG